MPNALYDTIGKTYNSTRAADPYLAGRVHALLQPASAGTYLDIGCGTGNYTRALHAMGTRFIGMDPSDTMLIRARELSTSIEWKQGTAENTQLNNTSVDGITAFLTIHHWKNITDGFREMHRVMKGDGNFVLFTSTPEQMKTYWLNHYFPNMMNTSMAIMPTIEGIHRAFSHTGWTITATEPYDVKPDLQDLFLQSGKYQPERYFDETFRKGISSFSAFSHAEEVKKGLELLRSDIDSGKFEAVRKSHVCEVGEYLFVVARKG